MRRWGGGERVIWQKLSAAIVFVAAVKRQGQQATFPTARIWRLSQSELTRANLSLNAVVGIKLIRGRGERTNTSRYFVFGF